MIIIVVEEIKEEEELGLHQDQHHHTTRLDCQEVSGDIVIIEGKEGKRKVGTCKQ